MSSVCVYCGSAVGYRDEYRQAARALGSALVHAGITLVYGGGQRGLMGEIADAVLQARGCVIGVIPKLLIEQEVGHRNLTEVHIVENMHERKKMMADLSDAFVALPGGTGTFEELFEIYTWAQLGYHEKPVGLLNVAGYHDLLLAMLHHAANEGFMRHDYIGLLQVTSDADTLLDKLQHYVSPISNK
ncbi:LOG family protein [Candidatus Vallotiella sp. (ex Adelges kitamiensis)]|uniref:LOG family protein n=1 Tax=Candidatus Vallotiella sp. (ex Adelges kitamiensis) TaxID=2864217 RepID=UPI001CE30D7F|nr:TIGR00730 family Rossman fold protein [Candidatus Vallotia sp. (ex Adelges kitamiensis)]